MMKLRTALFLPLQKITTYGKLEATSCKWARSTDKDPFKNYINWGNLYWFDTLHHKLWHFWPYMQSSWDKYELLWNYKHCRIFSLPANIKWQETLQCQGRNLLQPGEKYLGRLIFCSCNLMFCQWIMCWCYA